MGCAYCPADVDGGCTSAASSSSCLREQLEEAEREVERLEHELDVAKQERDASFDRRDEVHRFARMGFHEKHAELYTRATKAEAERDEARDLADTRLDLMWKDCLTDADKAALTAAMAHRIAERALLPPGSMLSGTGLGAVHDGACYEIMRDLKALASGIEAEAPAHSPQNSAGER